uniref:Leukosialin n=2 Tax=Electrophorus electricus TaxID=8005 RepID=A0AAY5EKN3_ELEEL
MPSSRGLLISQSVGVMTISAGRDVELLSSGESTSTKESTLTSAVNRITVTGLLGTSTSGLGSAKPMPEDSTMTTEAISMTTSAAETTLMLTGAPTYAVVTSQTSTAVVTEAGTNAKTSKMTHELADSKLTTSPQQENNGGVTDALSSTAESLRSSSKPPTPALTTATTTALTTAAMKPSEAVSTPLLPIGKTAPGVKTTSETTQKRTGTLQAPTHASETTFAAIDTIPGLNVQSDKKDKDAGSGWLIVAVGAAVVSVLVVAAFCIVFIKHRKKISRRSGRMNVWGRSQKRKGAYDDAWAGPAKLEGRENAECDGPEAGPGQGAEKNAEDTDGMLSTFLASGENGVGCDGSKEARKWEEQEPLLYIDEGVKQEEKEQEGAEKAKQEGPEEQGGRLGDTEARKSELNGETFCLTTAV